MNGKKLIELKEELFETGYVSFNLKDFSFGILISSVLDAIYSIKV